MWIMTLILVVFVLGCGDDGEDGDAYLRITWMYSPFSYWDNNSGIPEIVVNGQYYRCGPGTYNFEYLSWDDSYWYGYYTLAINRGEKGKFLTDGDDGSDRYFTLQCYSIGASFWELKPLAGEAEPTAVNNHDSELDAGIKAGAPAAGVSSAKQKVDIVYTASGPVYKQTIVSGRYTLELVFQKGVR